MSLRCPERLRAVVREATFIREEARHGLPVRLAVQLPACACVCRAALYIRQAYVGTAGAAIVRASQSVGDAGPSRGIAALTDCHMPGTEWPLGTTYVEVQPRFGRPPFE